jgi:hypothetical protein
LFKRLWEPKLLLNEGLVWTPHPLQGMELLTELEPHTHHVLTMSQQAREVAAAMEAKLAMRMRSMQPDAAPARPSDEPRRGSHSRSKTVELSDMQQMSQGASATVATTPANGSAMKRTNSAGDLAAERRRRGHVRHASLGSAPLKIQSSAGEVAAAMERVLSGGRVVPLKVMAHGPPWPGWGRFPRGPHERVDALHKKPCGLTVVSLVFPGGLRVPARVSTQAIVQPSRRLEEAVLGAGRPRAALLLPRHAGRHFRRAHVGLCGGESSGHELVHSVLLVEARTRVQERRQGATRRQDGVSGHREPPHGHHQDGR